MDETFVKLCLIYFDKIVVPKPTYIEDEVIHQFDDLSDSWEQLGFDMKTAVKKYKQVLEIQKKLEGFDKEGIVERLPYNFSMFGVVKDTNGTTQFIDATDISSERRRVQKVVGFPSHSNISTDELLQLNNLVLENVDEFSEITKASSKANIWACDSMSVSRKDNPYKDVDYLEYILNCMHRFIVANDKSYHITTNEYLHYRVMAEILASQLYYNRGNII